jgi:hypothetical protein
LTLRYTLFAEGSSDRALLPVLNWLLHDLDPDIDVLPNWADPKRMALPRADLEGRIRLSVEYYPCDLLFVHRDADREPLNVRKQQVLDAIEGATIARPAVCVIPVRMLEAWLLFDERAIREAAGNPRGMQQLEMPPRRKLEDVPDPKAVLRRALLDASGLPTRRRNRLPIPHMIQRLAELVMDFSPLRDLHSFQALEADLRDALEQISS